MNGSRSSEPAEGQLLKRTLLGSEAIYRVVGKNDRGVEVEVVRAPGLDAGSRFTFTLDDVLAMDLLTPTEFRSRRSPRSRRKFA